MRLLLGTVLSCPSVSEFEEASVLMLLAAWELVMPFQLIRWVRQCRVKTDRIVWVNRAPDRRPS
jgi:hypothetical protein